MSTLVLVLAVGVAVGTAPPDVSREGGECLHLHGEWIGDWWDSEFKVGYSVWFKAGTLHWWTYANKGGVQECEITDEGGGRLTIHPLVNGPHRGIYRLQEDRLIIALNGPDRGGRPKSFRAGEGQYHLILRRVRPAK